MPTFEEINALMNADMERSRDEEEAEAAEEGVPLKVVIEEISAAVADAEDELNHDPSLSPEDRLRVELQNHKRIWEVLTGELVKMKTLNSLALSKLEKQRQCHQSLTALTKEEFVLQATKLAKLKANGKEMVDALEAEIKAQEAEIKAIKARISSEGAKLKAASTVDKAERQKLARAIASAEDATVARVAAEARLLAEVEARRSRPGSVPRAPS